MSIKFKSLTIEEDSSKNYVLVSISGKLEKADYEILVPELEAQMASHGKINLLFELIDFHGWTAGAAWEDTKFGMKHFNDINKLAIVGDKNWEKGMALFVKVFTTAQVKYFDLQDEDKAKAWLDE